MAVLGRNHCFNFFVESDPRSLVMAVTVSLTDQDGYCSILLRRVKEVDFLQKGDEIVDEMKLQLALEWEKENKKPFPWGDSGGKPKLKIDNFDKI